MIPPIIFTRSSASRQQDRVIIFYITYGHFNIRLYLPGVMPNCLRNN